MLYNGSNKWTAAINFKETLAGYRQFGHHVLDVNTIIKATGLTVDEIESLKEDLQ